MKHQTKIFIGSIIFTVVALISTLLFVGGGLLFAFNFIGLKPFTSAFLASQIAILVFGLLMISFDLNVVKEAFSRRITLKTIGLVILTIVAMFVVNIVLAAIFKFGGQSSETTAGALTSGSILVGFILPVIVAPLVEEITFRLGLKKYLVDKVGLKPMAYVLISSILFGLLHWEATSLGLAIVIMTGTIGFIKSLVYIKTDNIWITVLAHMSYNGIIVMIASLL